MAPQTKDYRANVSKTYGVMEYLTCVEIASDKIKTDDLGTGKG